MQGLHLLLGDLHLFETGRHLFEREVAALATLADQSAQLLDLEERCFGLVSQKNCGSVVFLPQPLAP